ncbi:MAG: hypothetical protein V7L22_07965, partial [Nostoc sp.]|uniref:hypothetical protein n=1 Tax=Nostoc sp. TaxID=1180 RepID=UPI002FFC69EC
VFHASANKRSLVFSKFSSCTSLLYCQCVSSKYITDQWDVSLTCGLSSGMGCIGKSEDGSPIAIYVE